MSGHRFETLSSSALEFCRRVMIQSKSTSEELKKMYSKDFRVIYKSEYKSDWHAVARSYFYILIYIESGRFGRFFPLINETILYFLSLCFITICLMI